jgi:hypothetical protein
MRTLEEMRNILEIDPMNPDVDFALCLVPLKIIPLHGSSNYPIASLITSVDVFREQARQKNLNTNVYTTS